MRLQNHIGVSPTALRSLRARMESAIIEYQQRQNEVLSQISSDVEVCLAADETFFEGVILVMLDLPSGYIFVEEITEDCQYETWQQRVSQIFQPLGLKVKYLVSDRAKAIIKLALKDLGTNSISDLFHVLYDLNRSIGFELNRLGSRLEKQIERALRDQSKPEIIQELELKKLILQKSKVSYNHCCYSISTCLHPFDINDNTVKRLKVATIIHNFALKRNDGSTAASRLFGQQFPDLFEYLMENVGELPQPRKSRKSSKPQTFTLPTVPS